jgi:hypothetical protein
MKYVFLFLVFMLALSLNGATAQEPTPTPLQDVTTASCPVSLPNLSESPDDNYISVESGYGNPEQTLFIGLWPGGNVIFHPNGSGFVSDDGSLSMKFWFYRTLLGEVVIEGRRLDKPGPVAHLATLRGPADGYGETGFHPAGLTFPSQGGWDVTASVGDAHMAFVTLVVWVPFEHSGRVAWGGSADMTSPGPQAFQYIVQYPEGVSWQLNRQGA